jgi:hypothetical protein
MLSNLDFSFYSTLYFLVSSITVVMSNYFLHCVDRSLF